MNSEPKYSLLEIRRTPWKYRRMFCGRNKPWPYLLHPWEVNMLPDPVEGGGGYCFSGGKGSVGAWLQEWRDADWEMFHAAFPEAGRDEYAQFSPPLVPVPWLVAADSDKAHRCPVCGTAGGTLNQQEATGWQIRKWRVYHCREEYDSRYGGVKRGCGQHFARRGILLPELEGWHLRRRCRVYLRHHLPLRARISLTWKVRRLEAWWTWEVRFRFARFRRPGAGRMLRKASRKENRSA